jgi:PKD repeat protein
MKSRLSLVFVVVVITTLAVTWAVTAQSAPVPGPSAAPSGRRELLANYHPPSTVLNAETGTKPLLRSADFKPTAATALSALGQPGTSFRPVQTFGITERAYFSDTTHLNMPWGLATAGNAVWIAESWGERALKFTNTGTFMTQIGQPGFRSGASGTDLEWLTDVAIDSGGNIWLVDSDASHLAQFDASGAFVSELGENWNCGPGNTQFCAPRGIAFDGAGNIYVSDRDNARVQVFDSSGAYLSTIGETSVTGSDNAHFNGLEHLAIDAGNNLYVADSANHRVQIFNSAHVYLATIGVAGVEGNDNAHLSWPTGVTTDASYIYVADSGNHRVQIFNRATRAYVATLGTGWGSGNDQFYWPTDVAVDASGSLYVADSANYRVQQYTSSRVYARTYGVTGVPYLTDGDHYNRPSGVATDRAGNLYLTEERGQRLIKLNAAGVPQWAVGQPGVTGDDNAHLAGPGGVSLDSAGRIYVADAWNNRIQIFNSDGTYYATLGTGWGTGTYQFNGPYSLAIDKNDNLYVAERWNRRVQVYNNQRVYVATLGVTGVAGTDNTHFNDPYDIAVDVAGNLYVVDNGNHRVQVFNSSRVYIRTIGESGVAGDDFAHFNSPTGVAVDAAGRVYVADGWGSRVQVFDNTGAYLTTIGGNSSSRPGQFRQVEGMTVDAAGTVYTADSLNHRLLRFALGVPGWVQRNINGFGDRRTNIILALAPFNGQLYAGAYNWGGTGAQLWRTTGAAWTAVITDGFGTPTNRGIDHLLEFNGNLYAGVWNEDPDTGVTTGGEIWRSGNGLSWTRVVSQGFGDPTNGEVFRFAVFSDTLYATTWSYTNTHGAEIWRSPTGDTPDWTRVVSNGFGTLSQILGLDTFNGALYAGTWNNTTGGAVWRTTNGLTWTQVSLNGFGTPANWSVTSFAEFGGELYAGISNGLTGGQVWRCQECDGSDWTQVSSGGFGDINNFRVDGLIPFDGQLYAITINNVTGLEVWRTSNGTLWTQDNPDGFGNSNTRAGYWDNSHAVFNSRLFIGAWNGISGAQVWQKTVTADFTASPTEGTPPFNVSFINNSTGDYTTTLWDFGDGFTSTVNSPTHTYATRGSYTATLTIGDGVETAMHAIGIQALQHVYLPLILRNAGTVVYDDFSQAAFNGAYDPAKWSYAGTPGDFSAQQQNGALVFTNRSGLDAGGADLFAIQPGLRTLRQVQQFEARLKVSSDHTGGYAFVKSQIFADVAGHGWWTQCRLGSGGSQPNFVCDVSTSDANGIHFEYLTPNVAANYNTWYTARIDFDPATARLSFYLNGALVGAHTPADALTLKTINTFRPQVGVWNDASNTTGTRYVDDVRITTP